MNNNKKKMLGLVLMTGMLTVAQAEVLVILPESGPMARAASSIQQGFLHVYQAGQQKTPLRFVDSHQMSIDHILQTQIHEDTQLLVGPLSRQQLEQLIALQPQVKTLALNHVEQQHPNVTQFGLAKHEDAQALMHVIQQDGIQVLFIVRQAGTEKEYELFLSALLSLLHIQHEVVNEIPSMLSQQQGILLLGDAEWLSGLKDLPNEHIYATANAIGDFDKIPAGLKFCDTAALYQREWRSIQSLAAAEPLPFQRLVAFGADAAQLTQFYLSQPNIKQYQFNGRTGKITLNANQIQRLPACFLTDGNKIKTL